MDTRAPSQRRRRPGRNARGALLAIGLLAAAASAASAEIATLSFGVAADAPPLAFTEDGVLRGLEIDLARALADALGRELRIRALPQRRLLDSLRGGGVDVVLSSLDDAEITALRLAVSAPVLATGQMALVRAEELPRFPRLFDLLSTDARVGYERGSPGARFVQDRMPNAERVPLASAAEGIGALRSGDIALFIHDALTVWAVAADRDEAQLVGLFRPLTQERLAWVVRADDEPLRRSIDAVLADWRRTGALAAMIERWMPVQIEIEIER